MSNPPDVTQPTYEPSPLAYIICAKEGNRIAGSLLPLDAPPEVRLVEGVTLKYSLGLSLQAAELAGKAMLRSLGISHNQILRDHRKHKLPELMESIRKEAKKKGDKALRPFQHLLCTQIEVDGKVYGNTIGNYIDDHFSAGPTAQPRSYFYPDCSSFRGPNPPHALFVIVTKLIEFAEQLEVIMQQCTSDASA